MSFFGDIFAGKAEQQAANYNAAVIEENKNFQIRPTVLIYSYAR